MSCRPDWAPLDELVPGARDNGWARRQGLPVDAVRLLYAGTLGRKHNPRLLLELLDAVPHRGVDATLTVVSRGCRRRRPAAPRPMADPTSASSATSLLRSCPTSWPVPTPSSPCSSPTPRSSRYLARCSATCPRVGPSSPLVPGGNPAGWTSTTRAAVSPRPRSAAHMQRRTGCARSSRTRRPGPARQEGPSSG